MPIDRIFHLNIVCTDLERSRSFYELVGFTTVLDTGPRPGGPDRAGVGMGAESLNAVMMMTLEPDNPSAPPIDLMQWIEPTSHGEATHRAPRSDLAHVGMARLALRTEGIDGEYARLRDAGLEVLNDVVLNQVLVRASTDDRTLALVRAVQQDGTCWCGPTTWQHRPAMRISVSGWATTADDISASADAIIAAAQQQAGARTTAR